MAESRNWMRAMEGHSKISAKCMRDANIHLLEYQDMNESVISLGCLANTSIKEACHSIYIISSMSALVMYDQYSTVPRE